MGMLRRKGVILAKEESTYGTDPTPTGAANAILVRNINMNPLAQDLVPRDLVRPWLGNAQQLTGSQRGQIDFEVEAAGAGTSATTAPKFGPLLKACGFSETIGGSDVTYAPISTAFTSVTIYYHCDGKLHKLTGCRGTLSLGLNAKGIPVMRFSFLGLYNAPSDTADATPTYTGFQTPLIANTTNTPTFMLHGVTPVVRDFSIDVGVQRVHRELIGYSRVDVTDRRPQGSITIEDVAVATKAWVNTAAQGTLAALSIVHGTVAANKFQIDAPQVQLVNPQFADDQGVQMLTMGLLFATNTVGNDELTIKTL